jgi:glycosyltransferase involved in cell wall biosynthesis
VDLSTFLALTRPFTAHFPVALYMHENQLTYPLPGDGETGPMRRQRGERDLHYVFINYASMLAADRVFFNSAFHRDSLFAALPNFLKHFPEYNELGSIDALRRKSRVLPVGVDFARLALPGGPPSAAKEKPPLILWNQRWEYDKNPAAFFAALYALAEEGTAFRLALCGEQFGKRPSVFDEALSRLEEQIIHVGHAPLPRYRELLWEATVTASTAHHEFFGISILEAIYAHTFPVLPRRLSYPELLPEAFHGRCLYDDETELVAQLRWALRRPVDARRTAAELAARIARFAWPQMAPRYDEALAEMVGA